MFKLLFAATVSLPCLHRPLQGGMMLHFIPAPQPVAAQHQFQMLVSRGHIPPPVPPNPLHPDIEPGPNIIDCLCTENDFGGLAFCLALVC